jgi:F-type H+-transporting ATPase subunit delta
MFHIRRYLLGGNMGFLREGGHSRGLATETTTTPSSSLRLTFVSPHEKIMNLKEVYQVNIQATSGDMGILAQHVPCIEQLRPGIIEIFPTTTSSSSSSASSSKLRYFTSGGFAIVHPDSHMTITAIEAVPVNQLDLEVGDDPS